MIFAAMVQALSDDVCLIIESATANQLQDYMVANDIELEDYGMEDYGSRDSNLITIWIN